MAPPPPSAGPVARERALDEPDPAARLAFLRSACADDEALFRRVAGLLRADTAAGGFLGGPADAAPRAAAVPSERPGDLIGRYRLGEPLGEGGFGLVYRAEQLGPVRREVALKILKPGMDSRQVVARFEAERQVLARMEHPNIARVFDAGATGAGRPYLVMELVPGAPITQFCDTARLPLRDRLGLFLAVCDALQHAHQKGVIHRDLKPSNILVARPDPAGPGVPKVIDFGVAKAAQPDEAGAAAVTRGHEFLGTPAYMSPEQAGLAGRDVDTRADIYALGVLLHELLTGRTPLDGRALAAAGLEETLRRIREEEPARCSAVLERRPPDEQAAVARARRYESAAALAADLRRHLADEPVTAAAPGVGYRLGKFLRRHRLAVGAAGFAALVLLAATAVSLALAWRATQAEQLAQRLLGQEQRRRTELEELRRRADDEAVRARTEAATARAVSRFFGDEVLARGDPTREPERELTLRSVLDRASLRLETSLTNEPAVAAASHETLARAYQNLALHEAAARHWGVARDLFAAARGPEAEETLRAAIEFAFVCHRAGDREHALPLAEQAAAAPRATNPVGTRPPAPARPRRRW